jgi:hypothetical protein
VVPEPPQRELFPPDLATAGAIAINARCVVKMRISRIMNTETAAS